MSQPKIHRTSRILSSVGHAYPLMWKHIDEFRSDRDGGVTWPDWCFIPIAATLACIDPRQIGPVETGRRAAITAALGAWRMTQGIYRFDPALLDAVLQTPIDGDIPADHLIHMPEWCVYVELPGDAVSPAIHGAWIYMDFDLARGGRHEFRAILDMARNPRSPFDGNELLPLALPLGGSVDQSLNDLISSAQAEASRLSMNMDGLSQKLDGVMGLMLPILSIALYLCADSDIRPAAGNPGMTGRQPAASMPASHPTSWDVGARIGAALRAAYAREQMGGSAAPGGRSVRPHVRRAHWHTIISGPRQDDTGQPIAASDRTRNLRWMPPIPVNVTDLDAMPTVIHRVSGP